MARNAGRFGRLYMGIASSTAAAEPVAFITEWSGSFTADRYDVTALGDTSKVYVQGLPDAQGSFSGIFDNATQQVFTAATDGEPRRTYLYPDARVGTTGPYWYGTAFFAADVSTPVGDAVKISGSWAAATSFTRIG